MSKNWDKPLPSTYQGGHIDDFNEFHGTSFPLWPDVYEEIGLGRDYAFDPQSFLEAYYLYALIQNTPLGKALS